VKNIKLFLKMRIHFTLSTVTTLSVATALMSTFPQDAVAYIGPGAGLGAIGTAIALVGAVILLIVGFVWYPLKRLIRRRKKATAQNDDAKS